VDDLIAGTPRIDGQGARLQRPVNLGNPNEFTIRQLAETVIDLTGSARRSSTEPLPQDDPKQRQPDISLAKAELNWEPTTQLREGLEYTIQYFDQQLKRLGSA
jgi:UDP-glucuronate decarboxylase